MWPQTKVTKLLKIKFPIIQAPMAGGITTPELIAAVSNSGGLGSLGAGYMKPEDILSDIRKIRSLTDKPFAVNLFIPEKHAASKRQINQMTTILKKIGSKVAKDVHAIKPPYVYPFDEQVQVLIEEKIPIFSFTFGILANKLISTFKKSKTKLIGTATTVAEAKKLEQKGIDIIVAQGSEAGGHRGTFLVDSDNALIGSLALIPQIVDQVKIPVIAAGGIMDARGLTAALALGASGVQMGTAFITCHESGAHPLYKKALLATKEDNTMLTRSFSGKWARGIKNRFMQEMELHQNEILDYPIQHRLTRQIREEAAKKGLVDYMSMWSGQSACLTQSMSAAKLIQLLVKNVDAFCVDVGL